MATSLTEPQLAELKNTLRRCSSETVEAAIQFRATGNVEVVPTVVYGVIQRYLPAHSTQRVAEAGDAKRLFEDLGLDSLTMLEMVLTIEEVLNVRIENEEIKDLRTIGQVKEFLTKKISGGASAPQIERYSRERILLSLPQQPPFMFLDEAELNCNSIQARYRIRGDESFLEGHFKNDPIFPASIICESLGQAACLWVVESVPKRLALNLKSNQVLFASMEGAHFYRRARPGDRLELEQKLIKLRAPLAVFEGTVKVNGERLAFVEQMILIFEQESATEQAVSSSN